MNKQKAKHENLNVIAHFQSGFVRKQGLQSRFLDSSQFPPHLIPPNDPILPTYTISNG